MIMIIKLVRKGVCNNLSDNISDDEIMRRMKSIV